MNAWSRISHIVPSASLFLMVHASAAQPADKPVSPYKKELDSIVSAEVDYLLWFSNQDGLHSPTVATGKYPNLGSKWSSGVRAAIGGQSAHWDIDLCYTYYSTSSSDTANANIGTILSSTPSTAGIFEVGEKWHLNFNRLDLQLGRKLLFGNHFLLEPFFGVEGLDVSQKFDLSVNTIFLDLTTSLPATNIVDSKNKNSLLGIGLRAGTKANLDFKAGFGLYGNVGLNILWGRFKIKQDYNQTDYYSSGSSTVLVDQGKGLSQGGSIFNADLELGFNWRHLFPKPNLELALKAGWEYHYYADIVRFQDFYLQQISLGTASYTTNGNLTLSGLTVGAILRY
jgi:hypothetical protein